MSVLFWLRDAWIRFQIVECFHTLEGFAIKMVIYSLYAKFGSFHNNNNNNDDRRLKKKNV